MADTQSTSTGNGDKPAHAIQHESRAWIPLLVFILFTTLISMVGYAVFQHYKESIKSDKQNELGGIAELKTRQITNWMGERRGDAQALKDDPLFLAEIERWLQQGGPAGETQIKLNARLASLQQAYMVYGYTSVSLFDEHAMLRLSSAADEPSLQKAEKERLLESMRSGQIMFSDIHRREPNSGGGVEIELWAPLTLLKNGKTRTLGAVLFRIDPEHFLFPLIQRWPTPSPSAENILVRRDGDEVVFLNELRHRKNTALAMRLPLSQQQLPAAMAAMGQQGLVEGVDYRGVPVVSVLSKVAGTSWVMVSKIDKAEIFAPINQLADWMAILMLALVVTGGGITLFWRQKERRQYERELQRQALAKHLDYLSKYANDIILLMDGTGKIVDFNDRAIEAYGYTAEEFSGLHLSFLRAIEFTLPLAEELNDVDLAGALRFESTHVRWNGAVFPVEASVRRIDIAGEKYYQAIIRDISERKQAEEELRKSYAKMEDLYNLAPCGYHSLDQDGVILVINDTELAWLGYTRDEVIGKIKLLDLISSVSQQTFRETFPQFKKRGFVQDIELEFIRKDGTVLTGLVNATAIYDSGGNYVMSRSTVTDITGQKLSEIKLSESYKELQRLTTHLENIKEEERTRIARELHDEMGATLAAMKMRIAWLASKLPPELKLLSEETGHLDELVSDGINTVRQVVHKLRPSLLENVGLDAAIEDCVRQFRQNTNIECTLALPVEGFALENDQSSAIFRILQESLSNITKHAQATQVDILFSRYSNSLSMVVMDNGLGFIHAHKQKSFGLLGIRERALMAGGKAKISSMHGKGTRVSVTVPCSQHSVQEYAES